MRVRIDLVVDTDRPLHIEQVEELIEDAIDLGTNWPIESCNATALA